LNVLVTGAAGFIGSHVCETLLSRGDTVVGVDNFNDYYSPQRKRANAECFRNHPRCTFVEEDIRNAAAMNALTADNGIEAIVHLAAYGGVRYSIGRASLYTDVNIVGSVNMLEAARKNNVNRFVFASTSSVYGNTEQLPFEESDPCNMPLAPYPASKKAIESMGYSYFNLHQMNFTALRFFSVYGPRGRGDMMPFMVTDRIVRGEEIVLFDGGDMKRDWTYVADIVSGIIGAVDHPLGYALLNLGRGEPVLMSDFVHIVEELAGKKAILSTPPAPASEPKITFANIDRARKHLGYNPQTPVQEGLARMWEWYSQEILSVSSLS